MKLKRMRRVKIVCTLGPASRRQDTILKMARNGMDVVRLNFSHGDYKMHQEIIDTVRHVNRKFNRKIKILQDLEGYRLRIGHLRHSAELIKYQQVWMSSNARDRHAIPLDLDMIWDHLKTGMDVFIDDGNLQLRVLGRTKRGIRLEVKQGGILKSRKGVNIPALRLKPNILTDKDKQDISFGIKNKVDFIAQSFVRNKADIVRVTQLVESKLPDCQIIAKIENQDGVKNLEEIMSACDGIMVARGDLGVSLPIYQIPVIQKIIIHRCNEQKKMVTTATQMLESMIANSRPTRAEVSDVANAILDGTDYVMLSAETAVGSFPVKCVRMMKSVIDFTEKNREKLVCSI